MIAASLIDALLQIIQIFFIQKEKFKMSVSRFYTRTLPVLVLVAILATAAFAFAATNTVTSSYAGDGTGTVSGYTVTVTYNLNTTNPANLDSADLSLNQAAGEVYARVNGAGSWIVCTGAGTSWNCSLTGTTVASLTSLQVVAAE